MQACSMPPLSHAHPTSSTNHLTHARAHTCWRSQKGGFLANGPSPPWSGLAPSWEKNRCISSSDASLAGRRPGGEGWVASTRPRRTEMALPKPSARKAPFSGDAALEILSSRHAASTVTCSRRSRVAG